MEGEEGDSSYDSSFIDDSAGAPTRRHKRKRTVLSASDQEDSADEDSVSYSARSASMSAGGDRAPPPTPTPVPKRRSAIRFIVYKNTGGVLCGAEVRGEQAHCLVSGNVFAPDATTTKPAPLVLAAIRALRKRGEPLDKVFVPARNILFPGFKRVIKSVRQSGELVYGNPVAEAVVDAIRPIAVAVYNGTHVGAGGLRAQNDALQKKCAALETQNAELKMERDSLRVSLEAIA